MHRLVNCVCLPFQKFSTMVCLIVGTAVRCSTPGQRLKSACSLVAFLTSQLLQPYCMTDMIDGVANSPLTCLSELQGHLLRRPWALPSSYCSTLPTHFPVCLGRMPDLATRSRPHVGLYRWHGPSREKSTALTWRCLSPAHQVVLSMRQHAKITVSR